MLYTPRHDASFADLTPAEARRVVDLWAARSEELGAHDDVDYVLVFENRGPEVGATIAHPHGQIYALADVPPRATDELTSGDMARAPGTGGARRPPRRRGRRGMAGLGALGGHMALRAAPRPGPRRPRPAVARATGGATPSARS